MKKRRKATAAGKSSALALIGLLASACETSDEPASGLAPAAAPELHAEQRERLATHEQRQRANVDFAAIPASDGRFGGDPYRVISLPDARFAGLLRGADQLVLFDADGRVTATAPTVHDPTDLAWRDGELLVVGTGEPRIARHPVAAKLGSRSDVELPESFAPRAIAVGPNATVVVADEAGQLHRLDGLEPASVIPNHCRGPLDLEFVDGRLLGNCLLDHRVRVDELVGDELVELAAITHDGPIWSLAIGPSADGERLLALTGVEDHPLDRSDGGFGYIDSFVFIYALAADGALTRRAAINTSEQGVVTPKWSRWIDATSLELSGYATAERITLRFTDGFAAAPSVERRAALPGITAAVALADGSLLAADPLLDAWLRLPADGPLELTPVIDPRDDRSFDERLGEALVFTTAMAPWNHATDQRSRFTCETCHFEGRSDGRVHFTGRERDGQRVHATSKPLLGLFPNRPYFSRALDRSMAQMVDNEFRVANRHSGRDPWFSLDATVLPWLERILGWPGEVDGEGLRRALMAFLQRYSMPSNPAARGRDRFTALEREGARAFASRCEGCHQARLVSDDPSTRIPGAGAAKRQRSAARAKWIESSEWERLIFAANGPLVWASADYVATEIEPYVHSEGARVPSLRRLHLKWPYFTNGSASDLDELLAQIRRSPAGVTHGAGSIPADQQLEPAEREAIAAFLRLL